jgi:arylformamidase
LLRYLERIPDMRDNIFLHYSQSELDRNYDQRGWIGNAEEIIARYIARSEATRRALDHRRDVAYGQGPDELLDIFPAANAGAPTMIFLHGGAWRNFTKNDFSFVAEALVPAGIHVVVVNFSKLPNARLPDLVAQVRSAVAWVWIHAHEFGGDPQRVYFCGHSSGAHLAAVVLLTNWAEFCLPLDAVKGATCISGCYDLRPVLLSSRGSYIKVSQSEEHALSPARHAAGVPCPLVIVYAEHDTEEFKRHSREFADALSKADALSALICLPSTNHFEIVERITDPESVVLRAVLTHIEETTAISVA